MGLALEGDRREAVWKKMPRMEEREELGTWGETSLRKKEVWSDLKQSGVSDNPQGVRDCRSLTGGVGTKGRQRGREGARSPPGLDGGKEHLSCRWWAVEGRMVAV